MNAVQLEVGKALLGDLRGFRKAPVGDGFNRFAEVLCECSISVEHAMAIVETFDYEFPTLRDIRDAAHNLRPKFEAKVDQKKEWEAKYGKPDVEWSRKMERATTVDYRDQKRAMLWQAIRDSIYYTEGPGGGRPASFWSDAMEKHNRNHPAEVAAFRVQVAESGWDRLMSVDWLKAMPVLPPRQRPVSAITQADIDAELRRVGREPGDDE